MKSVSAAPTQAARERSELLSRLSHDLRTPLASMQGYLELLLLRHGSLEPVEAHNYLQTAVRQCDRLTRLVGDLFELARLEADDMQPKSEAFALAELVQDVVQKYASEARRGDIALAIEGGAATGPAAALRVQADIALVERVLDKLVDNALRHTPAGGAVTIEIACHDDHAQVAVRDTGRGIAAEDMPGIFERYERASRVGGAGAGDPAGLGLAIARRIVNLHGSQLKVHSVAGQGTRVSFELALAGAAARAPLNAAVPGEPGRAETSAALERSEARRAAAEAELRATEERYLLALRGSQDGLWEWDIATGAVHLSPRWKTMLGFESHELANDHDAWHSRVHPDDRAAFDSALARHLDGVDARFDHSLRLMHKDGSVRHVLSRGVAIRLENGAPYRMIGLDTDVTQLRRAQAVLDAVADGTAGAFGEDFFAALAQHFARALEVDCAFITECADDPPTRARTLAFWSVDKGLIENFEYALAGTPCEAVLNGGGTCFHREGLSQRFPREAGFDAYLGMPILASDGRMLGHLALLHKQPLGDEVLVDRIYRIFLARAAAEIERMQALAQLALVGATGRAAGRVA